MTDWRIWRNYPGNRMLLVDHYWEFRLSDGYSCVDLWHQKLQRWTVARPRLRDYANGKLPPRYPVPAIPLVVGWSEPDSDLGICHVIYTRDYKRGYALFGGWSVSFFDGE